MKNLMNTALACAALGFAACGGGGGGSSDSSSSAMSKIQGTWKSTCIENDGSSYIFYLSYYDGKLAQHREGFANTSCSGGEDSSKKAYEYAEITLGDEVTTSSGTKAWKINKKITKSSDSDDVNTTEYDLVAVSSNKLYFGKETDTNDGSTDAKRPTDLDFDVSGSLVNDGAKLASFFKNIKGDWTLACTKLTGTDSSYAKASSTFAGLTHKYSYEIFSTMDCSGTASQSGNGTDIIVLRNAFDGGSGVTAFNYDEVVIEHSNSGDIGDLLYSVMGYDSSKLYFGKETESNDGETSAKRENELDKDMGWTKK